MKVVIAGSASLKKEMQYWFDHWSSQENVHVLDWPRPIPDADFKKSYQQVFKDFYSRIEKADLFFVANEDKRSISGYIGSEVFAEIVYAVARQQIHGQRIQIILLKNPSPELACFEEIELWKSYGVLKVLNENPGISDKILAN